MLQIWQQKMVCNHLEINNLKSGIPDDSYTSVLALIAGISSEF